MNNNFEAKEKKTDFVKIIVKALSFILMIVSLLTINFTTWFKVDGLKRKEVKEWVEFVETATNKIEAYSNKVHTAPAEEDSVDLGYDEVEPKYETNIDKLIDSGVFASRRDMKKFLIGCRNEAKKIYSCQYKLSDFCEILKWCNELAGRVVNAKSDEYVLENLSNIYLTSEDSEALAENSGIIKGGLTAAFALSVLIALLGTAAAIFNFKDKAKALKYIYAAFALILCIAAVAVMIAANSTGAIYDFIQSEDLSLNITVWPIISAVAAIAPCLIEHFVLKGKN